jgi:4-amino-4-deoxy-L-arabinose transferase-like glycosyltransferase
MDVDAAEYAAVALEMLQRGDYLHVTKHYVDYLDKPPLLFWLAALSYKIFGISNFAYKFPSLLFALLGIFSTYKLGKRLYSEKTGLLSALILASSFAMFQMTNDVRTDTILTGAIIFSIWTLHEFSQSGKWFYFFACGIGVALAMLAKGPIGLMVPVLCFGVHFTLRKEWKRLFHWHWILAFLLVLLLISPMLIGLYQQFDLHPEKGISGIRFYFWDQSFGRLTGDNPFIKKQLHPQVTDPFFFLHTFLWAFLPWSIFFILGYWKKLKKGFQIDIKNQKWSWNPNEEAITIGGFSLVFLALSCSEYKLPHYIFILVPLASILTADYILTLFENKQAQRIQKRLFLFHVGLMLLIWILLIVLCIFSFPVKSLFIGSVGAILFIISIYIIFTKSQLMNKLVIFLLINFIGVNFMLSAHVYPSLLQYQSQNRAGRFILNKRVPKSQFVTYLEPFHSLDFYSQRIVPAITFPQSISEIRRKGEVWVFTNEDGKTSIENEYIKADSVICFRDYRVTKLTLPFLIPNQRNKTLTTKYLLQFKQLK